MFRLFFLLLLLIELLTAKPYVLLISWDGCRWDYPARGSFPTLKMMEENGVTATSLQPVFPSKTLPNHYSLVTGLYPVHHGIVYNIFLNPANGEQHVIKRKARSLFPAHWYGGEPLWVTARKNGLKSASIFWVGSEVDDAARRPDYWSYYDHHLSHARRIEKLKEYLALPIAQRPRMITMYFSDTDDAGHQYGPESPHIAEVMARLDKALAGIFQTIRAAGLQDSVNVILVSDHGMTALSPQCVIPIKERLAGLDYQVNGRGPVAGFFAEKSVLDTIRQRLKPYARMCDIYTRENLPAYYHFRDNPMIGDLVVVARPGCFLQWDAPLQSKGSHGYDNRFLDMHGVFRAVGPAFKKGYHTGMVRNIDVYPLVCRLLDMQPAEVDGDVLRIEHVLKNNFQE
ncbi:MAG: alkaline phosphatase family protein [Calditrichaeota bacterium]|nr:MAG: alkaline phosphatase family protein [Calditrichota bacterium]